MKRIINLLFIVLVLMVSCKDKDVMSQGGYNQYLTAAVAETEETRVGFAADNSFYWNIGDMIAVQTASGLEEMTYTGTDGQPSGTFGGNFSESPVGYALYPYNAGHSISGNSLTFNLPTTYSYQLNTNAPMWGLINDGSVYFRHLASFISISASGLPDTGDMIFTLTADKKITGDFTADLSVDTPVIATSVSNGNDRTVTVTGLTSSSGNAVIYVPVPLGTYESITAEISSGGLVIASKTWNNQTVSRKTPKTGSLIVTPAWDGQTIVSMIPSQENIGETTYQVYTVTQGSELAWLAENVNGTAESIAPVPIYVKLSADVNLGGNEWTSIGNGIRSGRTYSGTAFTGVFDGNGHTIMNLKLSQTDNVDKALGLFGVVDGGTVMNLKFSNVDINVPGSEMAGSAVGMLTGGGQIYGINVLSGNISAGRGNGSIVGRVVDNGIVSGCTNYADVSATGGANVGGIAGAAYYTSAGSIYTGTGAAIAIENCSNYGTVSGTNAVGGIIGLSTGRVCGCTNSAAINGNGISVGGIIGEQQNAGEVLDCVNSADISNISAAYGTGGIVGWVRYNGASSDYLTKNVLTVSGNTNSGSIYGGNDAGGIVGTLYHYGLVENNTNNAAAISAKTFGAGIVGNFQVGDPWHPGMTATYSLVLQDNVTTTTIDDITVEGACKRLLVYDNTMGQYCTVNGGPAE